MSIYDRPYMRYHAGVDRSDPLLWMLVLMVVSYFVQVISQLAFGTDFVARYLALSQAGLFRYRVWTVLTYAFVHGGPLHLIINLLIIFMVGKTVQLEMGRRRFLWSCFWSAVGGAALFIIMHAGHSQSLLLGASAIAMGLLATYCVMRPDQPITFLIFFVLPVTVRPKILLAVLALIEVIMLTAELQGGGVASSAHLGGMAAAILYYRRGVAGKPLLPRRMRPAIHRKPARTQNFTVNISSRSDLKGEVDRILDKINSEGFGSLTEEEKNILDHARDILRR